MSYTFAQMVDEIRVNLSGYTLRQDRISNLANVGGISATDLEIKIGSADNLAKGIIEIDDELIWINSFDSTNLQLNAIQGFGRGYAGTTPAPHTQNSMVTMTPTFPRVNVKKAINDTINSLYPKLFAVNSVVFTFNAAQVAYPLPADARDVLYISWQTVGPSKEWLPVNRWRMDRMANVAAFDTNKTVNIYDKIMPGRKVQVYYSTLPNDLTNNTDDFATVTGLPESSRDVVTFGAAYRLLSYLDTGRINLSSAEADINDNKLPSSAGASASKYVFALYQQRLLEESTKLQDRFPIRVSYTR
jgi:hypothetical protein